jgi:outer membrane protein OmpA-like peptidoglycan-associated protein
MNLGCKRVGCYSVTLILRSLVLAALLVFVRTSSAQIEKLPITINSPIESDILPVISVDGNTLYFARTRVGLEGTPVFDIWYSHLIGDDKFESADVLGGPLGSRFGIAVTSVSPDNNTLYLIGKLTEDAPPSDRLLVTHRTRAGWSIPQPLHINDLNARNLYTDYSFGPDQKTLLMSVERDSTMGDRDLYVSFMLGSGDWSTPRWLGAGLNSEFTEMTPFLAADNRTLYFSSNRPGGIGEVDVYRAVRLDDSWQKWSPVENLGASINRAGRTTFYTEDAQGKYAYFSWRLNERDQSDIYRTHASPRGSVALVHGRVIDNAGKPVSASVYYNKVGPAQTSSRDLALGSARSNPETGEYQIVLPAGEAYVLFADKDGYFVTTTNVDLQSQTAYTSIERDLVLTHAESGASISLNNILFETDRATLLPSSFVQLDQVFEFMQKYLHSELLIRGHTDSTGIETHNLTLSAARAGAVRQYLIEKGITASRLQTEGKGSGQPVASNDTEEGRARNRRVEFVILKRD